MLKAMTMKKINFVYSRNKLDFKKYTKITEYDDVISYHDIITKLVKNDSDNERPSEYVVNSYLRKKIVKTMVDESSNTIIYALKEINAMTVDGIKELMMVYYNGEVEPEFNLIIIDHKKLDHSLIDQAEIDALTFLNKTEYVTV